MTRFNLAIAILACSVSTSSFAAPPDVHYRVTRINADPPPNRLIEPAELNDKGVLAAFSNDTPRQSFLWDGELVDLSASLDGPTQSVTATGINNHRDVTLIAVDTQGVQRAYVLRRGRDPILVEVLAGAPVVVNDINNRRQVVGNTIDADGHPRLFIWKRGEATLLSPPPFLGRTFASEINDHGDVVGDNITGSDEFESSQALLWKAGEITEIVPAATEEGEPIDSTANAINDRGQVVGSLFPLFGGPGDAGAYVWQDGQRTMLPSLFGGTAGSAQDINNSGDIVGQSSSFSENRATLWRKGVAIDLTQQIDSTDPLHGVVSLISALKINNRGQILAFGNESSEGALRLYLLDPVH